MLVLLENTQDLAVFKQAIGKFEYAQVCKFSLMRCGQKNLFS